MKIEFSGMLDGEAKKFAVKQFNKYMMRFLLIVAVGLLPASLLLLTYNISVCHILGWVGIGVLGLSVVLMVCALIVNAARGYKDVCNRNVVVEDGEIKYSSGKNSDKKSVESVQKVVDYGEFYRIVFSESFASADDCICQKSLLCSGTTEDFETLFEGKMQSANK